MPQYGCTSNEIKSPFFSTERNHVCEGGHMPLEEECGPQHPCREGYECKKIFCCPKGILSDCPHRSSWQFFSVKLLLFSINLNMCFRYSKDSDGHIQMVLWSTHNICFGWYIGKILFNYAFLSVRLALILSLLFIPCQRSLSTVW